MQLSPEARKRAVDAFKLEFKAGLEVLRMALANEPAAWQGKEIKSLLHRFKGGAGFLAYENLRSELAELETQCADYPQVKDVWVKFIDVWEDAYSTLS